jgi:tetratricopeptide (TPR) repeat protein
MKTNKRPKPPLTRAPAPPPARKPSRLAWLGKRIALGLCLTLLFFGAIEGVLRAVGFAYTPREKKLWKPTVAGFVGTFEYYIETHFAPPGYMWVSEPNTLHTDRYGFRKPEIPFQKEPGKYRVAFLGGSTTQGGNRPYPERTIRLLNIAAGTNRYEMLNIACSSYSSHQSLIALQRWGLPRKPDLAIIYHGWNDSLVAEDGFSDHEKDVAMNALVAGSAQAGAKRLARLRVFHGVGRLIDALDLSWPRIRVPPDRFDRNLSEMARMCREAGVEPMFFIRPNSRRRPLPEISETAAAAYRKAGFPEEPVARYDAIHRRYTDIVRQVAQRYNARTFDALGVLDDLQARRALGEFGDDIEIFMHDAIHIFEFAEEKLAIELACAIAPDLAPRIRAFTESADYHLALAREFLEDDQVFEAAWHAREAIRRAGGVHPDAQAVLAQAESQYEFVRLFREGKWGGTDDDFASKIRKLQRCLAMRPSDFGVCLQIYRVCVFMQRIEEAAAAMAAFVPANTNDAYQWLTFTLQSHAAAQRWREAGNTALEILKIRPNDPQAQQLLRALRGG